MTRAPDGRLVSVNVAPEKGARKTPVDAATLVVGHGLAGDGHAGPGHRQVSLLALESIGAMRDCGLDVGPGDFAENLTTEGIAVVRLPVGARVRVGPALLEVTQIGKVCHDRCEIFRLAGDCVMPREGIFARVLEGGEVRAGDDLVVEVPTLIRAAVLTFSDKGSRCERDDLSGDTLVELLESAGAHVAARAIVPDEREAIAAELVRLADDVRATLVLTTGGTGLTSRDVTPEATRLVIRVRS